MLFTDEQQALRKVVRKFGMENIAPRIEKAEREGCFPRDILKDIGEAGFFGCSIPEAYGGSGPSYINQVIVMEELSRWIGVAFSFNQQSMLVPQILLEFGSEEQRRQYIPKIINGELIACFALTEPDVGSDAAQITTRASKTGNQYVLNGTKMWSTYGPVADVCLLFARSGNAPGARGISCFLIDLPREGVKRYSIPAFTGTNCSPTGELVFDGATIPSTSLVGEENEGFKAAMGGVGYGRLGMSARCIGVAQAALEKTLAYANQRKAFGAVIGNHQMVQRLIADMVIELEAGRALLYQTAALAESDLPFNRESSITKVFTAGVCKNVVDTAVEVHGAYGISREYQLASYQAFANVMRNGEGPPNIQRILIAQDALGYKNANRHSRRSRSGKKEESE